MGNAKLTNTGKPAHVPKIKGHDARVRCFLLCFMIIFFKISNAIPIGDKKKL